MNASKRDEYRDYYKYIFKLELFKLIYILFAQVNSEWVATIVDSISFLTSYMECIWCVLVYVLMQFVSKMENVAETYREYVVEYSDLRNLLQS